jgi:hypothetical protein
MRLDYINAYSFGAQVALKDFWNGRAQWEPTWQGESTDMLVDYVRVWAADV